MSLRCKKVVAIHAMTTMIMHNHNYRYEKGSLCFMINKFAAAALAGIAAVVAMAPAAFAGGFTIDNTTSYGTVSGSGYSNSIKHVNGQATETDLTLIAPNATLWISGNQNGISFSGVGSTNPTNNDPSFAFTQSKVSFSETINSGETFTRNGGFNGNTTSVTHHPIGW